MVVEVTTLTEAKLNEAVETLLNSVEKIVYESSNRGEEDDRWQQALDYVRNRLYNVS